MLGLLGVGIALTLGAGMRLARRRRRADVPDDVERRAPARRTTPLIDEHVLGAITLVTLALLNAGNAWGLGRWWSSTALVRKHPVLK